MVAESGWYHGARKPSSLAEGEEGPFLFWLEQKTLGAHRLAPVRSPEALRRLRTSTAGNDCLACSRLGVFSSEEVSYDPR